MTTPIMPLSDNVLVQKKEVLTQTASGIYLPETMQDRTLKGTVVAVGSGRRTESGTRIAPDVEIGATVVFRKGVGVEFSHAGTEYLILSEYELLAVLK